MDEEQKKNIFKEVNNVSRQIMLLGDAKIVNIINELADDVDLHCHYILEENRKDLQLMDNSDPKYDRLLLTEDRIKGITQGLRDVAKLDSPVGKVLESRVLPNRLQLSKITVPFGVVGIIYEARPNVTLDVFTLCLKSQNACILKGGSDAHYTNVALVNIIHEVLENNGVNPFICTLLDKDMTTDLLQAVGCVDVIIPRGSKKLIDFVRENAKIPVIETGAGVCHCFFDKTGDLQKGTEIIYNAKTRKVSVCNSLDCLIVHRSKLKDLPTICEKLKNKDVVIYADKESFQALKGNYPDKLLQQANEETFGTEFLDYKLAIKTVSNISDAVNHITEYGSKHSEVIISESEDDIAYFFNLVDAACLYSNASISFTDGGQFGLGAEIGISTQKLHARGPMGLAELCSYKWIVKGDGQIRE